jgi:hypothetical protein
LITFSRWFYEPEFAETYRMFSLACAMLLREGVKDPSRNIALVAADSVATILVSNQPLSEQDLRNIRAIAGQMEFRVLFLPGEETPVPELRSAATARTLGELRRLSDAQGFDYSPVFDSSPYFFNSVRLRDLPRVLKGGAAMGNVRALFFVLAFMLAASILVALIIVLPLKLWAGRQALFTPPAWGGIAYFISIGMGFMLVEIAMMQQLSIYLGHPVYSLVVVLAGLILSTGVGSLASDRLRLASSTIGRMPALAATLILMLYSAAVIPIIHRFIAETLWQRALICVGLVAPCGFAMGFCFPVGLRWMTMLRQKENLPWMWALNGAAATLASFVAIVISMESSIATCVVAGAACYLLGGAVLPSSQGAPVTLESSASQGFSTNRSGRVEGSEVRLVG